MLALMAAVLAACTGAVAAGREPPTPTLPATAGAPTAAGQPGELIAALPVAAPAGGRAWLVEYHSRSVGGDDVAERALLVTPATAPPDGGFPLVVWGHPSKGLADHCAPSAQGAAALPLVENLVTRGYAVVAPDYEGLGAAGSHPYLVGASEARAMLDAARVASRVSDSGVERASPVALWGYSQGGHAAAFAAEEAPSYAPELSLRGAALVAPVADVGHFVAQAEADPAKFGLAATVILAYTRAYPELRTDQVFTPAMQRDLGALDEQCLAEAAAYYNRPVEQMLATSPLLVPAFAERLNQNQAGHRTPGVPLLVVQGTADQIIDPADTEALVQRYCQLGTIVAYVAKDGENHGVVDADLLLPWLQARVHDQPQADSCPALPQARATVLGAP